jgi:DNA-binding NarL/FixJ family response regulator
MQQSTSQRVAVVDGDPVQLATLIAMLRKEPGIDVVGYGSDGFDLVYLSLSEKPDVAVCDLDLPGMDALAARPLMRAVAPDTQMLVVTDTASRGEEAVAGGAESWVDKHASRRELLAAIESLGARREIDLTTGTITLG